MCRGGHVVMVKMPYVLLYDFLQGIGSDPRLA